MEVKPEQDTWAIPRTEDCDASKIGVDKHFQELGGDHSYLLDLVKQELTDQSYKDSEETKLGKEVYKDLQDVIDHSTILANQLMHLVRGVSYTDSTQECHSGAINMKTSEDMNTKDSICITDKIIDESCKILSKEDFLIFWKSHTAKLEEGLPMQKKIGNHKCDLCDYSSTLESALRIHVKSVHLKEKNHKCEFCEHSSSNKGALRKHIQSVHLKERNYKCDVCDYSSSLKGNLQKHVKYVHMKEKNHKCDFCDYSSSLKGNVQNHIKAVHLRERNHKCQLCNYSSIVESAVRNHVKAVHLKERKYKCDLCDYTSSRKWYLQKHILSVHLIKKSQM